MKDKSFARIYLARLLVYKINSEKKMDFSQEEKAYGVFYIFCVNPVDILLRYIGR